VPNFYARIAIQELNIWMKIFASNVGGFLLSKIIRVQKFVLYAKMKITVSTG